MEAYVAACAAACSGDKPSAEACALACALCEELSGPAELRLKLQSCCLEAATKSLFAAAPTETAAACRALRAAATAPLVETVVLPAALRALKRNPDTAAGAVALLAAQLDCGLAAALPPLLTPLLILARSPREEVRASAAAALASLARKAAEPAAAVAAVAAAAQALLGGSEGRLKEVAARAGLLAAVGALAAVGCPPPESLPAFLADFARDEAAEDARLAALAALTAWAPLAPALPGCGALLAASLKEVREPLRRAALRLLLAPGPAAGAMAVAAAPGLVEMARAGLSKAAQRWEGLAALSLLLRAAAADAASARALEEAKLWPAALGPTGALLQTAAIARLPPADAAAAADVAEALLAAPSGRLKGLPSGAGEAAARLLALLALHPTRSLSRHAAAALGRLAAASGSDSSAAAALVAALGGWLAVQEEEGTLFKRDAEEGGPARAPPDALMAALRHLAGSPPAAPPSLGTLLLLTHRCVPGACLRADAARWASVAHQLQRTAGHADALLDAQAPAVLKALLGTDGLASPHHAERAAGLAALRTLSHAHPAFAAAHALPALLQRADRGEHDGITPADVAKWATLPGRLSTDPGADVYVATVTVSDSRRKARGRFKTYDNDEEDDPVPVAKPVVAKAAGGKPAKEDPREAARQRQLAEEAAVRSRVAAVQARLEEALAGLSALASGSPSLARAHGAELAAAVLPLLASPLVGVGAALAAARCLVASSEWPPGQAAGSYLAAALRLCADAAAPPALLARDVDVQRTVAHLTAACAGGAPLPTATYTLCFSVLERLLLLPTTTPLHASAFATLALHANPELAALPHAATLRVLYHALEAGSAPPGVSVEMLLRSCCAGLRDERELLAAADGLLSPALAARTAVLAALTAVPAFGAVLAHPGARARLFLATHDADESVAAAAAALWAERQLELSSAYAGELLPFLARVGSLVRAAAARAIAAAMALHPASAQPTLVRLFAFYAEGAAIARAAAVEALRLSADALTPRDLPVVCTFLLRALADEAEEVRDAAVRAGVGLLDLHGAEHGAALLPLFENALAASKGGSDDALRGGVVVLLGAMARHLPPADPRVRTILQRLVETLATPAESVQRAVADCLPPLVAALTDDERRALVAQLLATLTGGARYADRCGAAFGLAGVVKGLGISALKSFAIVDALKAAAEDKGSPSAREGALLAFQCLCAKLGRLFEPYVIHILPLLLACFGDANAGVRDAALGAANGIMAQLSGQGVKLVLPGLLRGVEDKQWRTKQGSVQLLGAMAHCAPKQLTACLPTVVPRLAETLTDTHPRVAAAAREALLEVGSVIKNPEIGALVPSIMEALLDPNGRTNECLDALLETTFVNSVDAPSLALLLPIITRGLRERKTELKKKGAKIVGNMCSLVASPADLAPYVPLLLPELRRTLVDPIPEVRAIAARALASLLQGMGQVAEFADLLPWLLQALQSDASSVERSGAAQGLAEVLAVLGGTQVADLLPGVVEGCTSARAAVRDGNLTLLRFLPTTLGAAFEPHLPTVLPCILGGLSDEAEGVREAAMGAGRIVVERYARTALPLLLPAVEAGIGADNWRIRQSSVELLGELLFKVCGASGKIQTDDGSDDDSVSTEAQGRALTEALGEQRKGEVLAAIYLARSDVGHTVRTAALHVWKSCVVNTPRTLGELLPVLMQRIIAALAASGVDARMGASRCLGELVRKLAERVLPTIVPILQAGLGHADADTRQGVCLGLSEVLTSATRVQLAAYYGRLIPTVQAALCDESAAVRTAAGAAFNQLFRGMADASAEIVPALLASLEGDKNAVEGLKQVLKAQPRLLASVLPRLAAPPLTAFTAATLGELAEVAGAALPPHLPVLIPPLLVAACSANPELAAAGREGAEAILVAVEEGAEAEVLAELLRGMEDPSAGCRAAAAALAGFYFRANATRLAESVPVILTALIRQLADAGPAAVQAALAALGDVTGGLPKEELAQHVRCMREGVVAARDRVRRRLKASSSVDILVPGFCLPKALSPLVAVYLQAVLQGGSTEARVAGAEALGELVAVASEESVKPSVITIAGQLIRVMSEKVQSPVKAAIVQTLGAVIAKAGTTLKPLLPQLQTTFVKSLQDGTRAVRTRSASALGLLMALQTRVDPLCAELLAGVQAVDADPGIREAQILALRDIISRGGQHLTAAMLSRLMASLQQEIPNEDPEARDGRTAALGAAVVYAEPADASSLIVALSSPGDPGRLHRLSSLAAILVSCPERVLSSASDRLTEFLRSSVAVEARLEVRQQAVRAVSLLLAAQLAAGHPDESVVALLAAAMQDQANGDVRRAALHALRQLARQPAASLATVLPALLPPAAAALSDAAGPVRLAAEHAVRALCFQQAGSLEAAVAAAIAGGARAKLSDATLRRLSKLDDGEL